MRNGFKTIAILVIALLLFIPAVWGEADDLVSVDNKLIRIFVNNSTEETGRFAVDTIQGDPERNDDNHKPLIYGHPRPWTSFTTIRIDDRNYVFGKSTAKRAGAGLPGGEMVEAPHRDGATIVTRCLYNKIIAVEQILDITSSPSTGALDTARIRYVYENRGDHPVEVGLRVLLDTMLGSNDGASFRVGDHEVTADYALDRGEMPDFWQAFDSLDNPAVIAQSTLKGGAVTPPDRLVFSNWGKAADNPWDFPVETGSDFTRLGENELDSAAVMYWMPRKINPGEQYTVVIYYGLGDITFAPGKTFLGISAPDEVEYNKIAMRKYSVVLYMEHLGEATARNVKISLELPFGLTCISGNPTVNIDKMQPGVTRQFSWEIRPNGAYLGDTGFQIHVTGEGLEPNQVLRKIRITGPPLLTGKLVVPRLKAVAGAWNPNPLSIRLTVRNIGQAVANEVTAVLECEDGFRLMEGERAEKYLIELAAGQSDVIDWHLAPHSDLPNGRFRVTIRGLGLTPLAIPAQLDIPSLPLRVKLRDPGPLLQGQVFYCDIVAQNLVDIQRFSLGLRYNPKQLRLVSVSRGLFAVEENNRFANWSDGAVDISKGIVKGIAASRMTPFRGETVTLARLNFIALGNGKGKIELTDINLADMHGKKIKLRSDNIRYSVEKAQL